MSAESFGSKEPVVHLSVHQAKKISEDMAKIIKDVDRLKRDFEACILEARPEEKPAPYDDT